MRNLMIAFLVAFVAFVAVPAAEAEPQQRSLLNVPCDVELYINNHRFIFDDEVMAVYIDWAADFNRDEIVDTYNYDVIFDVTITFRGEYRERNDDGEWDEWKELDPYQVESEWEVILDNLILNEEWDTWEPSFGRIDRTISFPFRGYATRNVYYHSEASDTLQIRNAELDDIVLNGDVRCRRR